MRNRVRKKNHQDHGRKQSLAPKVALGFVLSSSLMLGMTQSASAFDFGKVLSFIQQKLMSEQITSSLKVLTKQDSLGANLLAESQVNADKLLASTKQGLEKQSRTIDVINNYAGEGAVAHSARCTETNARFNDSMAAVKTDLRVKSESAALAESNWTSVDQQMSDLNNARFDLTCSLEQGLAGLCTPRPYGLQYHDVDFSYTLSGSRINDEQYLATRIGAITLGDAGRSSTHTTQKCAADDSQCNLQHLKSSQRNAVGSLISYSVLTQLNKRLANGSNVGE